MLRCCSVSVVGTCVAALLPVNGSGDVEVQTSVGKQRTCTSRDEIWGFMLTSYTYGAEIGKHTPGQLVSSAVARTRTHT